MTINNKTPRLKLPKSHLGMASNEVTGGGGGGGGGVQQVCSGPTLTFSSALGSKTLSCLVSMEDS